MRRIWEYPKQVRAYEVPRYLEGFVTKEATAAHEAWLAAQTPKIHIDRSLLRGIRTAAVKTRESLLVDEERAEEPMVTGGQVAPTVHPAVAAPATPGKKAGLHTASQAGETLMAPASGAVPAASAAVMVSASNAASVLRATPGLNAHPAPSEETVGSAPAVAPALVETPGSFGAARFVAADISLDAYSSGSSSMTPSVAASAAPCGLTTSELAFLRALLDGDDAAAKAAVGAGMASLMVDAVNEKLYDEIGDAAIEFDGDTPQLVEDYRPDVEELFS